MKRILAAATLAALLIAPFARAATVGGYPNASTPLNGTERILADQTSGSYPCVSCTVNITPSMLASYTASLTTAFSILYNNNGVIGGLIPSATGQYCLDWTNLAAAPALVTCTSGSSAFSALTSGTNTTAAMVVGSGATLSATGTGTIGATSAPLTGITGLGTGVGTALAVNTGSAGAFVVNGGALGTPSSGVGTNITGVNAASVGGYTLPCTVPTLVSGDYLTNNGTTCSWAAASGGGTVTTTGTPTTGVLAAFSGSTSITNATAAQVATTLNGGTSATTTGVGNAMLATGPVFTLPGYATASLPTCNSGATGELAYTTDGTPSFTFCNGTSWVQNGGTLFTMAGTGCTPTAATGDATGGSFTLAAGPCTAVTITFNGAVGMTAAHLWVCEASDQTLQAAGTWFGTWGQSASTTTTATIPIPSAAGSTDVITFSCTPH